MSLRRLHVLVIAVSCLSVAAARAHHSFAAEFDYDVTGTIEGEVIEVLYVNPHVRYFVAVVDSAGNETIWDTQTSSVNTLLRYGWTKDTIELGDKVKLTGNLGRDNTRKLWIREAIMPDGTVVRPVAGGVEPGAEEAETTPQ
ncbi:MAG TPA: DUF6152 family protein [Gammaproteobacteria bacterium]|jgi:hypothetical protein